MIFRVDRDGDRNNDFHPCTQHTQPRSLPSVLQQGLIHVEGRCSPVQTLATSGLPLCITLMLLCNFSLVDMLITGCRKELATDLYQPLGSNFGNSFYFFFFLLVDFGRKWSNLKTWSLFFFSSVSFRRTWWPVLGLHSFFWMQHMTFGR